MKVAILMPMATQRGGGELMLWQLMQHGRGQGIEWHVIFLERGPLVAEFERLGVSTSVVETGRLRHVLQYVRAVLRIARIVRREDADLVFSWSGKPHLYGSPAAWLAGRPAAWYQLGFPFGRHLSWMDRVATLLPAEAVVTLSEAGSRGQAQLWPSRSTELVYPSVDLRRFDPDQLPPPAAARERLGLPQDGPLVGIVGRLQRWKGIHVLIKAMPRILASYPKAHAVVVGGKHALEPDYPAALRNLIAAHGLERSITLAGYQENVPLWTQAMDVVVHASDNEPFGIVVIEAMALGKPVVAGDAAGPREIITEDENGLLAPYGDAEALARQVLRYLDDPSFADCMASAARQRALDFAPEQYAQHFTQTLRSLMSAH